MTLPDRRCHSATVQGFLTCTPLLCFTLLTVPPYAQLMGSCGRAGTSIILFQLVALGEAVSTFRHVALAACVLAAAVGGCAVIDRADPRHDTINRAAANARNESILLNIVRASHDVPLNFVAFSRVSGGQSAQANVGLPSFGVGPVPLVTSVQKQTVFGSSVFNANTNVNNSFDISILESKDFYSGLLTPVDLATLNYFARQGYSRQLLFWLFVESIRETVNGQTYEYRNDPVKALSCDNAFPKGRRCFSDVIDDALRFGVTVQTETVSKTNSQGRTTATVYGRLCYDEVLARRAYEEYRLRRGSISPRCSERWTRKSPVVPPPPRQGGRNEAPVEVEGNPDTLEFEVLAPYRVRYVIVSRSTFGIYRYLGGVLRNQHDMIMLRGRRDRNEPDRIPLLEISTDSSGGCFVDLHFEGQYYCAPKEGAETTKAIFGLLAQLIALRTPNDLAITPAVRVTQ